MRSYRPKPQSLEELEMNMQSYKEAWAATKENKERIFSKTPGIDGSGFSRALEQDSPQLAIKPKFKINREGKIFTIGSCFARNVENFLVRSNFSCITAECSVPGELYLMSGMGARNGALNAYTPHSMLDTVTLVDRSEKMTVGMIFDGERYHDMITSGLRPLSPGEATFIRRAVLGTYERIHEASTVIITLGYTESWYDNNDEVWVNKSPAASRHTVRYADRFSFSNITATEAVGALNSIIDYINGNAKKDVKIILTASPVPLHGTFTNRDVVCANAYSKSTLLSAAVSVSNDHDNVDYFPSYELVTMSRPELAWEADGIHVRPSLVERVMSVFQDSLISD